MSEKLTTEQFINKAVLIHNNLYDYSLVFYTNTNTKVPIICKKHGIFLQSPGKHLMKRGCPICAITQRGLTKRTTNEEFLENINTKYSNKFNILEPYITDRTKIDVVCQTHNVLFKITPKDLLKNGSCPECRRLKTTKTNDQFLIDVKKVHGEKYTYLDTYRANNQRIRILCNTCNRISNHTPNLHLAGHGCGHCGHQNSGWGYTNWKEAGNNSKIFDSFKVYLIECWENEERFYKIGKTFKKISQRFKGFAYQYKVIQVIEGTSDFISELENKLLQLCGQYLYSPKISFGGQTECFQNIDEVKQIFLQHCQ
jgi:hypothetical protein